MIFLLKGSVEILSISELQPRYCLYNCCRIDLVMLGVVCIVLMCPCLVELQTNLGEDFTMTEKDPKLT